MALGTQMFAKRRRRQLLIQLSQFAGLQLGLANYNLWKAGEFAPFGMTRTISVWTGSSIAISVISGEDPQLISQLVQGWFMRDHKMANQVGVALDAKGRFGKSQSLMSAVCVTVRLADNSCRFIVIQPYTPKTDQTTLSFELPTIDAPQKHQSVLSNKVLILRNVVLGRRLGLQRAPEELYRI
jgi:hypothetical protein